MNRTLLATVLTVFVILVPLTSALSGTWYTNPDWSDPNTDLPGDWMDIWEDIWEDLQARRYEITPWLKAAGLPSADNAALLYYQACVLRPKPDDATWEMINAVLRGAEPEGKTRTYLGHCRDTIRLAEMAGQMPQCTWGFWHPDGRDMSMQVLGGVRQLAFVLAVDARTLAYNGHERAALARCLTIRQLARHIGDDTLLMFLVAFVTDTFAHGTMQDVLGIQPTQAETLQWLRGQLAAADGMPHSLAKVLYRDFELAVEQMRQETDRLAEIRTSWPAETSSLTDEELVTRARGLRQPFQDSIQAVLDSDMPYEPKQAEIERLGAELEGLYAGETLERDLWLSAAPPAQIARVHDLHTRAVAYASALKIAVAIYIEYAETGRLPEALPEHMPKDPFSGRDFEYEVTADGFLLRRHVVDPEQDKLWEYEFQVRN